jgi:UDP-N-acetylmuramoyl-L-alanyl-D-glutamate--2,6-diaminopimelate ligase
MAAAMRITGMTLGELLGDAAGASAGVRITDLVLDSEAVTPGAAFVAVQGARTHGLDYAARAMARGASIVLFEPPSDGTRPAIEGLAVPGLKARLGELAQRFFPAVAAMTLTGVTGTNGKSTVAWLVAEAMNASGRASQGTRCGYIGTLGFGVPPQLGTHALTTPDCLTLHRELTEMSASHAALEVSSHALAQDRVAGLRFAVAVFTNLTHDHLDAHGDFASYGLAKARLFQLPGLAAAVLNLNDAFSTSLRRELANAVDVIGTVLDAGHAVAACDVSAWPPEAMLVGRLLATGLSGTRVAVSWRGREAELKSPLIGRFNAENLLSALGALLANGLDLDDACAALGSAAAPPGRMEVLGGGDGPVVVVDYAHTPDALERVLTEIRAVTAGTLTCIFGCGGDRDRAKRPLMGAAAARHADRIVLTDDNPRGEDAEAIVADIRTGIPDHMPVTVERDRARAIADAIAIAGVGDAVVVAGKGHESEQLAGTRRLPFSDRVAVRAALRERGSRR